MIIITTITTFSRFSTKEGALGTSHIIRKVLQSGEVYHWFRRRSTKEKETCDKR